MDDSDPAPTRELPANVPSTVSGVTSSGTGSSHRHRSAHIHETEDEFGEVKDAKIATIDIESSQDDIDGDESGESPHGVLVLLRRLVRPRHVRQYFKDGTLYRESTLRKVGMDELFLDLIVVANVAAIGHELRGSFNGWLEVEKFFLLFQAIWFSWRENAYLWNIFTNVRDLPEKIGVLSMVTFLCGIGLGAHDAFDGAARWVSFSAFYAIFNITVAVFLYSARDPINQGKWSPAYNNSVFHVLGAIPTVAPYLAAAIVGPGSERAVRNLWWVAFGLSEAKYLVLITVHKHVLSKIPGRYDVAVNIESLTEKFGLLTIIVLGESLLAILFEASEILSKSDLGRLYLSAFLSITIAFSLFTLYFDVDQRIMEGGIHAIRYNSYLGVGWNALHLFLQAFLILGATGIGLTFDEASLKEPTVETNRNGLRAEADETGKSVFGSNDRWLFCAGVAASMFALMATGLCHKQSPHAKSRLPRWVTRSVSAIAITLLPVAGEGISALGLLAIVAGILGAQTMLEFVLVEVDHLRLHGWTLKSSKELRGPNVSSDGEEEGAVAGVELVDVSVDVGAGGAGNTVDETGRSLRPVEYKKAPAGGDTRV